MPIDIYIYLNYLPTGGVPAPMFLHSEPLNDSAIKVTWKAPLEATMEAITYYSLRYQQKPLLNDVKAPKEIIRLVWNI
jgi:hypothetical protein